VVQAAGFASLPMNANYYADLESRFDIPDDLLAQLKQYNILYDADAQGAFFQLYSRPFAGGMFFEILQCRDGFDRFGAANAPFQIAAQKRLLRGKDIPRT
jgi:4-hydroxyphenylpyruvate dioxygenase